ncbi:MAG: hypothetical protein ABSC50_02010 [Candidatus Bathyarchaeia archaeon]
MQVSYPCRRGNRTERCYARLDDKKDVHVLAAFEKFKCDVLVTGDGELLKKVKGANTTKQALGRILGAHEMGA